MSHKDKEIRESLSNNLDTIISFYVKDKDFEKLMESVNKS